MSEYYEGPTYGIRDPQAEVHGPKCSECGWDFRHLETIYQAEDELLCADCLRGRIERMLENRLGDLAEMTGYSPIEYDAREGHL